VRVNNKNICIIVTHSIALTFYRGQLEFLIKRGFSITVVCDPRGGRQSEAKQAGCEVVSMHMNRPLTLVSDVISFIKLLLFFLRNRFDMVQVTTPKASLLGSVAARISGQPIIVYTHRGIYYQTQTYWKKRFFSLVDRLVCHLVNQVECVSKGIRKYLINSFNVPCKKAICFLEGSGNGVDLSKWKMSDNLRGQRTRIREGLGIPQNCIVIGYCGRLVKDKGIRELVNAFESLNKNYMTHLLLVGEYEQQNPIPGIIRKRIKNNPNIHIIGWQIDPISYFASMDIFTLPSYREGFPSTIMEASAMELPIVATNILGINEAVLDNVTGVLIPLRNTEVLASTLEELIIDSTFRKKLGEAGKKRIEESFDSRKIWAAIADNYDELISDWQRRHKNTKVSF